MIRKIEEDNTINISLGEVLIFSVINEKELTRLLHNKTEFEKDVLIETFRIPRGKVSTYKQIANKIGRPNAYRAVGNALHKNPYAPIIPCHRVVRSDGGFGGSKTNANKRRQLLKKEEIPIKNGIVIMSDTILMQTI
jgi:methylated-DNA-[protein]-cysteine S-methyltransferase